LADDDALNLDTRFNDKVLITLLRATNETTINQIEQELVKKRSLDGTAIAMGTNSIVEWWRLRSN
jgi:hypothetical protein